MKKTKTLFLLSVICQFNTFAQFATITAHTSTTRNNIAIGYQKKLKNWNIDFNIGMGIYGRKKFNEPIQDGYYGVYQIFHGGYFKRKGFMHNLKGASVSTMLERRLFSIKKFRVDLGLGASYYYLKDHYEYYYSTTIDQKTQTDEYQFRQNALSLDLGLFVQYDFSERLKFRLGFGLPSYFHLNSIAIDYDPTLNTDLPLFGFEPNGILSISYDFKKNKTNNED